MTLKLFSIIILSLFLLLGGVVGLFALLNNISKLINYDKRRKRTFTQRPLCKITL